jgi:hypothetical protein
MKDKDKSFKTMLKELENMMETSPEVDVPTQEATQVMDYTDDFMKNKEIANPAKNLSKVPVDELTPDQKEMTKLRNLMGNIRANKRLGDLGLSSYAKQVPAMTKQAKSIASRLMGGLGKVGKAGVLLASPLALAASEVLASDDLGENEEMELEKIKRQKQMESIIPKEVMEKSEQISKKPITAGDLIKTTQPMIKSVGGEPDMKPKKAMELVGEQESPDTEEMDNTVDYEDYLRKKKRQFGY